MSGEGGGRGERGGRRQGGGGREEAGMHGEMEAGVYREGEQKETGGKTESNG